MTVDPRTARVRPRSRRPHLSTVVLGAGIAFACWVYAEMFTSASAEFFRDVRWPFILAGGFTMIASTRRPARWPMIVVATTAPTALAGCFFLGVLLASGGEMQWDHLRMAATMLGATLIGAIIGRVAGGIRGGGISR